jgi:hypothetical protein
MIRFSRFALLIVPSLTLSLPSVAHAQRFGSFAGGINASQGPALAYQSLSTGVTGQASLGYRLAPRLRVRFDAMVSRFTAASQQVFYPVAPPCPSNVSCGGQFAAPLGSVGVAAVSANELFDVVPAAPRGLGFYMIAGAGTYVVFQHPTAPALMRFGLSGGAGLELRLQGSSALFLEARYHGLMNAPADARWLVPVTVGMRF